MLVRWFRNECNLLFLADCAQQPVENLPVRNTKGVLIVPWNRTSTHRETTSLGVEPETLHGFSPFLYIRQHRKWFSFLCFRCGGARTVSRNAKRKCSFSSKRCFSPSNILLWVLSKKRVVLSVCRCRIRSEHHRYKEFSSQIATRTGLGITTAADTVAPEQYARRDVVHAH